MYLVSGESCLPPIETPRSPCVLNVVTLRDYTSFRELEEQFSKKFLAFVFETACRAIQITNQIVSIRYNILQIVLIVFDTYFCLRFIRYNKSKRLDRARMLTALTAIILIIGTMSDGEGKCISCLSLLLSR